MNDSVPVVSATSVNPDDTLYDPVSAPLTHPSLEVRHVDT
jgi:hypothetical protein